MIQEYNMDLSSDSFWLIEPPGAGRFSQELPVSVQEIGRFDAGQKYYTKRREKPGFLLICTIGGAGELIYLDGSYSLTRHSAALIDCSLEHCYCTVPASANRWQFYWMHLSGPCCQLIHDSLCLSGYRPIFCGAALIQGFQDIIAGYDGQLLSDVCRSSSTAFSMLSRLLQPEQESAFQNRPHFDDIERVKQYIRERYVSDLGLDTLAQQAGISKYYFLRLFREYVGTTPYQYLLHHRINESKKLLRTTNHTGAQISKMAGFSDEYNYNRCFRLITGQTPGQYRRSN